MNRSVPAAEEKTPSRAEALLPRYDREEFIPVAERVILGVLVKPWGTRGEQTVHLYNKASDLLERVDAVFVSGEKIEARIVEMRSARWVGKRYVVHLEGIDSMDDAEALRGLELSVPLELLPELDEEDEYYVRDLLGMAVVNEAGEPLGTLDDVFSTAANDVYVIRGESGENLIPATDEFVLDVDMQTRTMRVHTMEL
jgi:16S rRNA processing protein RimM